VHAWLVGAALVLQLRWEVHGAPPSLEEGRCSSCGCAWEGMQPERSRCGWTMKGHNSVVGVDLNPALLLSKYQQKSHVVHAL
jgi:hypothetical protein